MICKDSVQICSGLWNQRSCQFQEHAVVFQPEQPPSSNLPEWPTQRGRGDAPALCSLGLIENKEWSCGHIIVNLQGRW